MPVHFFPVEQKIKTDFVAFVWSATGRTDSMHRVAMGAQNRLLSQCLKMCLTYTNVCVFSTNYHFCPVPISLLHS